MSFHPLFKRTIVRDDELENSIKLPFWHLERMSSSFLLEAIISLAIKPSSSRLCSLAIALITLFTAACLSSENWRATICSFRRSFTLVMLPLASFSYHQLGFQPMQNGQYSVTVAITQSNCPNKCTSRLAPNFLSVTWQRSPQVES